MKVFVKNLIPPLLLKWMQFLFIRTDSFDLHQFHTYAEALLACKKSAYDSEKLIKCIIRKNIDYKHAIKLNGTFDLAALRTIFGISLASEGKKLNVLDFGGGGGYHYTIANTTLGKNKELKWNVVETALMVKEAQRISDHNLKFFDNIKDAKNDLGSVDVIFTSSTLQYLPDPLHQLRLLLEVGARYLFITRTPFNDATDNIITLQTSRVSNHGPGPLPLGFEDEKIVCPITYMCRKKIEDVLREKYVIRFMINEGQFILEDKRFAMYGYFCELM